MPVKISDREPFEKFAFFICQAEPAAFCNREDIFLEESISLPQVVFHSPLPLSSADMINCPGEYKFKTGTVRLVPHTTSAMAGMKMCKHHISYIPGIISSYP